MIRLVNVIAALLFYHIFLMYCIYNSTFTRVMVGLLALAFVWAILEEDLTEMRKNQKKGEEL